MNPSTVFDAAICVRLVTTFAHFLWQEAAILALVAAAAGLFRRASADARYAVFLAGLFILAACPPATYLVLWQAQGSASPPPASVSLPPAGSGAAVTPLPLPPNAPVAVDRPSGGSASGSTLDWRRYAPQVVLAYVLGAAAMLVRLVLGLRGGQRLRRSSQPLEDATILTALARQARAVGLRFTPAIALCRRVAVPTVVGVLRPMVLLPLAMASQLTPEQVEVLLAHELAHIRRCDHLVNLLQRVIEALLFFHPAVWLISRRIRIEREHCCDDTVLAVGGRRLAYAESLLRVAELGLGPRDANWAAALGVADRPSQLRGRIMRLLCGVDQERIGLTRRGSTTIGIVLAIALAGGMWLRGVAAGNAASSQPGSVSTD
ncbi:MAG: M56 family metallopeptidase, partial [Planctomycetes bacterium]|nr:M56 family metallopeptidase [Planctomycetota bacterium]